MTQTEQFITLQDGRKLGFAQYGDFHGKPLFFFHGWPNSRLHAEVLDKTAKKRNIRIISPDRPGYGISDFQKNRTLLDYPRDIEQLADALSLKRFGIIGNSGGGPYAAVCAYSIPHRITKIGIVVGLGPTYIDGVLRGLPFFNRIGWENYGRFPLFTYLSSFMLYIKAHYFSSTIRLDFSSDSDKKILAKVPVEVLSRRRREAFRKGLRGPARDLLLYSRDWKFPLSEISVPTFLWYGDEDQKVSLAMGNYYASTIPNSTLTIFRHEGHMIIYPHMEEILETLV